MRSLFTLLVVVFTTFLVACSDEKTGDGGVGTGGKPSLTSSGGEPTATTEQRKKAREAVASAEAELSKLSLKFTSKPGEYDFKTGVTNTEVILNYPLTPTAPKETMEALQRYIAVAEKSLVADGSQTELRSRKELAQKVLLSYESTFPLSYFEEIERKKNEAKAKASAAAEALAKLEEQRQKLEEHGIVIGLRPRYPYSPDKQAYLLSFPSKAKTSDAGFRERIEAASAFYVECHRVLDTESLSPEEARTLQEEQQLIFAVGALFAKELAEEKYKALDQKLRSLRIFVPSDGIWAPTELERVAEGDLVIFAEDDGIRAARKEVASLVDLFPVALLNKKMDLVRSTIFPLDVSENSYRFNLYSLTDGSFVGEVTRKLGLLNTLAEVVKAERTKEKVIRHFFGVAMENYRQEVGQAEVMLARDLGWKLILEGDTAKLDEAAMKESDSQRRLSVNVARSALAFLSPALKLAALYGGPDAPPEQNSVRRTLLAKCRLIKKLTLALPIDDSRLARAWREFVSFTEIPN